MKSIERAASGEYVLTQDGRALTLPADTTPEGLTVAAEGFFAPDPSEVPGEVPMYKVRKLLIKLGMKGQVEAAIAAMQASDDPATRLAGDLANEDWEYAPNLVSRSPLVQGLGAAIGKTPAEIDALIVQADAIP